MKSLKRACFRACIRTTSVNINCTDRCTLDYRRIESVKLTIAERLGNPVYWSWHRTTLELNVISCCFSADTREYQARGPVVGRPSFLNQMTQKDAAPPAAIW